tara:strand:- start:156 stop:905 length:750 start_codon:yes stop_codon:yes gene_type:complete
MPVQFFTVFAPQRSGTNFVQYLLTENFVGLTCEFLNESYVWKHEPNFEKVLERYNRELRHRVDHLHLVLSKNPYKWIESIIRRPVDIALRRPQLLEIDNVDKKYVLDINMDKQYQKEWVVEKLNLIELVNLYNEFYSNWYNIGNRVKFWGLVKYERLLVPEECTYFLDNIWNTFKFIRQDMKEWKIPRGVLMSETWTEDVAKQKTLDYLDQRRCSLLTNEQIEVIDQNINKTLLKELGYSIEKPISIIG